MKRDETKEEMAARMSKAIDHAYDVYYLCLERGLYTEARGIFAAAKSFVEEIVALVKEKENASKL